jgi:hypothetical protein
LINLKYYTLIFFTNNLTTDNAQCFFDLMVMEGMQKMGSPELSTIPFDQNLVKQLMKGEIEVSRDGADWLGKCILKDRGLALNKYTKCSTSFCMR